MLYLTTYNTTGITDSRFAAKGLSMQKPGPISALNTVTSPQEHQIAYDGYLNNIDAFLAATAIGEKVNCSQQSYQVPLHTIEPTFPLPLPRVVFSPKKMAAAAFNKIMDAIKAKSTIEPISGIAKHPHAIVINSPTWTMLRKIIVHSQDQVPQIDGTVRIHAAIEMQKVYAVIELYLRTNTYPAFKDTNGSRGLVNAQTAYPLKRPGEIEERHLTKKPRYANITVTHESQDVDMDEGAEKGVWFGVRSDRDVSFNFDEAFPINEAVFFAKPSPVKDSRASWSTPKNVPALPGLIFEYFDGMNLPDSTFIRTSMSRFAIRMLGKAGFIEFRDRKSVV